MTFIELGEELKKIRSDQKTIQEEDYIEMVIRWVDLEKLCKALESFFGKPTKVSGAFPDASAQSLTSSFGGIRQNQTLYSLIENDNLFLGMLWPWADGMLITVKVIKTKCSSSKSQKGPSLIDKIKKNFKRPGD